MLPGANAPCFHDNIPDNIPGDPEHYDYKLKILRPLAFELPSLLDQIACPTARYRPGAGSRGRSAAQVKNRLVKRAQDHCHTLAGEAEYFGLHDIAAFYREQSRRCDAYKEAV